MWTWLRKLWKGREKADKPASVATGDKRAKPSDVLAQAGEIVELSRLAEMLHPEDDEFLTRIRRIRSEMSELQILAARPEFRKISGERLRNLDKGMALARKQLLDVVRHAPAPTSTLQ